MNPQDTADLLQRALAGDQMALTRLVEVLTPVIQARVARTLLACCGRAVRQEVEDLSQDTFLALFAKKARTLRRWRAERGSLENLVGKVAENQVKSFLRSWRNPRKKESPLAEDEFEIADPGSGSEEFTASRELLACLLDWLRKTLTPLGYRMFDLLFVQELSQTEVQAASGLSADAVYAWRSRLRRLAEKRLAELSGTGAPARKT